ncbi:hypothetical protein EON79_08595 [bacterium]|nr:MAG: hypothetical protein EON79_08595 [bacterium]
MILPEWVFLGYRVKRPYEAWGLRICCVGESLCEPPEGWVDRWDFNIGSCYSTPEDAWATVSSKHDTYRLFAYDLLPLWLCTGDEPEAVPVEEILDTGLIALPPRPSELLGMKELGYDVAERFSLHWPYSPLLNNGFSEEFTTNGYGLIDDIEVALQACCRINERIPEHHKHWLVKVFAKDIDTPLWTPEVQKWYMEGPSN